MASAFVDNLGRAGTQEDRLVQTSQESFRASEINTQNWDARIQSALSQPGSARWDDQALPTMADGYAQVYGGDVTDVAGSSADFRQENLVRMMNLANQADTTYVPGVVGLKDLSPTKANAMRLGLLGPDGQVPGEGTWSSPVRQSHVVGVPLPPINEPQPPLGDSNPLLSTLTGIARGVGGALFEMVAPVGDFLQVGNELGRSWATGEAPRDINYISGIGKMAGQGASTAQIVNSGFVSLMTAPDRITTAYQRGEYQQMGEEIGALGVGAAAAATGTRGSMPSLRMGVQLAAEDFAASNTGQSIGLGLDRLNYQLGNVSYVVAPQKKVTEWSNLIPENSPYVTPYDPAFPGRPDPAYSIDTSLFSSGTPTSGAGGGLRNPVQYWKGWATQVPESLSEANILRITEDHKAPIIDSTWVRVRPQDGAYLGDSLVHHHSNFGQYAIPVPKSTHMSSSGIWHLEGFQQ